MAIIWSSPVWLFCSVAQFIHVESPNKIQKISIRSVTVLMHISYIKYSFENMKCIGLCSLLARCYCSEMQKENRCSE